jgi:hypothetical protein
MLSLSSSDSDLQRTLLGQTARWLRDLSGIRPICCGVKAQRARRRVRFGNPRAVRQRLKTCLLGLPR